MTPSIPEQIQALQAQIDALNAALVQLQDNFNKFYAAHIENYPADKNIL